MQAYEQLELEWAKYNDVDHSGMVACSSGTSALHLALEAMRLPPGSEVVVPDLTMIAVPRAVSMAGLTPVFVDCDDTLNMDGNLYAQYVVDNFVGHDIGAVIAVHTYGKQCDMSKAWVYADEHHIKVIEDLAEAHGIRPYPETNAACWSFYKNKIVAGEEGGAVWFRDPEHAQLARQLRSLGFTDAHDFTHVPRGMNYRMSNAHAALVLESLRNVERSLENRWMQWEQYDKMCPVEWRRERPDVPWVYKFRVAGMTDKQQNDAVRWLRHDYVEARHCFKSCALQEEYRKCRQVAANGYMKSVIASQQVIYLPLYSASGVHATPGVFDVVKRILDRQV